ncbi:hypothetical protein [Nicoliella lavandulae]|uniref:Lipoprotein n=1 Tax=Nicoliella lavandulae TaxID=3082954 RepID=A0ABU8SKC2_9LACO
MKKALLITVASLTLLLSACGKTGTTIVKSKFTNIDTSKYQPINEKLSKKKLIRLKPNNMKYLMHHYSIKGEITKIGKSFQGSATFVIKDPKTKLTYASVTNDITSMKAFQVGDKVTIGVDGLSKIAKNNNLYGITTKDNPSRLSTVTYRIGAY